MKISIIVPIYNREQYLKQCIDSILNQSYKNIELILIDDGSTDNSLKIIKEYASIDQRIVYIHQKNIGISLTRNSGLRIATGDYITFMDCDDYWDNNKAIQDIVDIINKDNPDLVMHKNKILLDKQKKIFEPTIKYKKQNTKEEVLIEILNNNLMSYSVWDKVIKRNIIYDNNLYFNDLRCEDIDYTFRLLYLVNKISFYNKSFYVYRKGHIEATTSKKYPMRIISDTKTIIINNIEIIKNIQDPQLKKIYMNILSYIYSIYLSYITITKSKQEIQQSKQYQYLLKCNMGSRLKLISIVYKFTNYNITRYLLSIRMKKRVKFVEKSRTK